MDTFLQYLLSIEEFMDEKRGSLFLEKAFRRVDEHRREKAAGMRPGRGQAASLGAGLLIQLALEEMRDLSGQQDIALGGHSAEDRSVADRHSDFEQAHGFEQMPASGQMPDSELMSAYRPHRAFLPGRKDDFCCKLKQYTVSSLLTQLESRDFFPVSYRYGDNGKPYFKDYPYYFSISHSGDYVLCVISQKDIGADIQQWRKCDVKRLAGRFFSDREKEALMQAELFFRLWARKEAYGKLAGGGIGYAAGVNLLPGMETVPDGRRLIWTEKQFYTENQFQTGNQPCAEKQLLTGKHFCTEKQFLTKNQICTESQFCAETQPYQREYSIAGYNIAICQYDNNDLLGAP